MSGHADVIGAAALALIVIAVLAWLVSLRARRTDVAALVWGIAFVVVAWVSRSLGDGNDDRRDLLTAMVTIWGLRLTLASWRSRHIRSARVGPTPFESIATVFGRQGLIVFVISLPIQLSSAPPGPDVGWLAVAGTAVWGIGLFSTTRLPDGWGHIAIWWGIYLVAAEVADARLAVIGPIVVTWLVTRRDDGALSSFPPRLLTTAQPDAH